MRVVIALVAVGGLMGGRGLSAAARLSRRAEGASQSAGGDFADVRRFAARPRVGRNHTRTRTLGLRRPGANRPRARPAHGSRRAGGNRACAGSVLGGIERAGFGPVPGGAGQLGDSPSVGRQFEAQGAGHMLAQKAEHLSDRATLDHRRRDARPALAAVVAPIAADGQPRRGVAAPGLPRWTSTIGGFASSWGSLRRWTTASCCSERLRW